MAANGRGAGNGNGYALRRRTRRNLRQNPGGGYGDRRLSPLLGALVMLGGIGLIVLMVAGIAGILTY